MKKINKKLKEILDIRDTGVHVYNQEYHSYLCRSLFMPFREVSEINASLNTKINEHYN